MFTNANKISVFKALSFFIAFISVFHLSGQTTIAQNILETPTNGFRNRAEIVDGDTIPVVDLNTVEVSTYFEFKTQKQRELWTRTKFNVKKVYPYAIIAAAKLKEYDLALSKIENERLRKEFIKVCEKDLRKEFEDELKGLSVSQGKILMKLIDREAGKTTYEVVKQLRGSFQAAMWQTIATIFGHNMKSEYDANVEDVLIERAVKLIEAGEF